MNKWSRNSIYGAGLASLLYLGCGNSVQNIDTKFQEYTDLGFTDKNLDDFYQPVDSSLEDRINPIDSRELDYPSEDSNLEQNDLIAPDSLEYGSDQKSIEDDYSIDLGSDHVNGDASLDDYVSNDLDYCNSLEINSSEWCENCNTVPVLENAYLRDPKEFYASWEHIYICAEASDPNNNLKRCAYGLLTLTTYELDCNDCGYVYAGSEGTHNIVVWAEDTCNNRSEPWRTQVEIRNDI